MLGVLALALGRPAAKTGGKALLCKANALLNKGKLSYMEYRSVFFSKPFPKLT